MDVDEARAVLGVVPGASEADERSAFRRRLRATHPDVAGPRADAPAEEAFVALLEAAHAVGDVTYVDARLGLLEAVLADDGGNACQLLITLQGRATGTEAFCTLEPLGATPCPSAEDVVAGLVAALGEARR